MRKMVQTAERDRTDAVQKAEVIHQQQNANHNPSPFMPDYQSQLDRIGELERDHLRLTATQTLAEVRLGCVFGGELYLVVESSCSMFCYEIIRFSVSRSPSLSLPLTCFFFLSLEFFN